MLKGLISIPRRKHMKASDVWRESTPFFVSKGKFEEVFLSIEEVSVIVS
jgi:hypothetical protein